MEAMVAFAFGGAIVGCFVSLLWLSIDAVLGTSTRNDMRALGTIGICVVSAEAFGWGMILYDEIRS